MGYWGINGKNEGQKAAMKAAANAKPFLFLTGPAGTGKTLIASAVGLHKMEEERYFRKMIYTRLQVQLGMELGFLAGDLIDGKTYPFIAPFMDNLELLGGARKLNHLIFAADDKKKIFFDPIQTMRGRSIMSSFIMIDEAQNLDPATIFALATRPAVDSLGRSSKLVFMGNFAQIDDEKLRTPENNGMYTLLKGLYDREAHEYFDHVNLTEQERHPIIGLVEEIMRNHEMPEQLAELEARGNV